MNDICGINGITPRWGLDRRDDPFHRALPYANDYWAFSPLFGKNSNFTAIYLQIQKIKSI